MASTTVPSALRSDKALVRQVADFDDDVGCAEDFAELMKSSAKAPLEKDAAALRKRMKTALGESDVRRAAQAVSDLAGEAARLADRASQAHARELYDAYMALWTRARGMLAQALVEVGAIEPLALRKPVQQEQAQFRAQLDAIEKSNVRDLENIDRLKKLLPELETFLKRLAARGSIGGWMRTSYAPLLVRVQAAVKRVPAERCRRTLLAELDFVEVDANKALAGGDVKAVQSRCVPTLQRIERLATRVVAASPAVDRELARQARALATGSAPAAATKKLKALIQAKASTWPAGADLDGIEAALSDFEADLARLADEIEKAAARAPAKS